MRKDPSHVLDSASRRPLPLHAGAVRDDPTPPDLQRGEEEERRVGLDRAGDLDLIRRGLSGFEKPSDALQYHSCDDPVIEGVPFSRWIYHDVTSGYGRTFWVSLDERIVLLAPALRDCPFAIQVDGDPLPKPNGLITLADCASYAVKHMRKLDALHEDLEDSPDGE